MIDAENIRNKIIEILNKKNIKRFVFTSTCSNYDLREVDTPADENSELNPQSLYVEIKVFFEKYISNAKVKYKKGSTDPRNHRAVFDKIRETLYYSIDYSVPYAVQNTIKNVQSSLFEDVKDRKNFYGNYFINSNKISVI